MPRGIRKAAIPKLPDGVKWATQVPILVIPSAGSSAKLDGADGGLRRRPTSSESEVRLRYPPCCDQHKGAIKVDSLVTDSELQSLCSRFSQHYGHGRLLADRAKIDWQPCTDKVACEDCLADYNDKRAA